MRILNDWSKRIQKFIESLDTRITPKKMDLELRNIEENNKDLSEMEIIKLKQKYLNSVDKRLDEELERIIKSF